MSETDRSLGTWIHRRARLGSDAVALQVGSRSITYRELSLRIDRAAGALAALGIRPGDRVAFSGPPGLAYLETLFATTALGGSFTPVNPRSPADVAAWIVEDVAPRVLVRHGASSLVEATLGLAVPTVVAIDGTAGEEGVPWPDREEMTAHGRRFVPGDALALLMYTSGTTGRPKGVMLTHAATVFAAGIDNPAVLSRLAVGAGVT